MIISLVEHIINGYFAFIPRRSPSVDRANGALLIAHRGAHNNRNGIIENTLEAFRLAKEAGCWGIELDVHATADHVLVVNHDPTLNRLWRHNEAISSLNFKQLRRLVPGVPSLAEVIAEFGGSMHLFIELKAPFKDECVLFESLKNLQPCLDYHLLSLDASIFKSMTQFTKHTLLLVAVHNNLSQLCDLSIRENYGGVLGSYLLLTNKLIRTLKVANKVYGVGFVDSKYSLYRELHRGVHWLFTNHALSVSQFLKKLTRAS